MTLKNIFMITDRGLLNKFLMTCVGCRMQKKNSAASINQPGDGAFVLATVHTITLISQEKALISQNIT